MNKIKNYFILEFFGVSGLTFVYNAKCEEIKIEVVGTNETIKTAFLCVELR